MLFFASSVDGDAIKYLDKTKLLGGLTWVNMASNRTSQAPRHLLFFSFFPSFKNYQQYRVGLAKRTYC